MQLYTPTDWLLYYTQNTHQLLLVCHFVDDFADLYRTLILLLVYLDFIFFFGENKEESLLVYVECGFGIVQIL